MKVPLSVEQKKLARASNSNSRVRGSKERMSERGNEREVRFEQ
jgi:hypothetical protein